MVTPPPVWLASPAGCRPEGRGAAGRPGGFAARPSGAASWRRAFGRARASRRGSCGPRQVRELVEDVGIAEGGLAARPTPACFPPPDRGCVYAAGSGDLAEADVGVLPSSSGRAAGDESTDTCQAFNIAANHAHSLAVRLAIP